MNAINRRHLCASALSALSSAVPAEEAQTVRWSAGNLPPFAWQEGNEAKGYACDLIAAMGRKLGRPVEIQFYPWARAVKLTLESSNVGIFPLARTPDREDSFAWLIPLAKVDWVFLELRRRHGNRSAQGEARVKELQAMRVGVMRGSPIINNLHVRDFRRIHEGKDYKELLRMLTLGQIDAIYAGRPMILASVSSAGLDEAGFHITGTLGEATIFVAASKGIGDAEANRWRAAYESLRSDGTVAQLQRQYGLTRRSLGDR